MSRQGDLLFEDSISHGAGRRGRQERKSRAGGEEGKRKIFPIGKKPVFHEIPDSCTR